MFRKKSDYIIATPSAITRKLRRKRAFRVTGIAIIAINRPEKKNTLTNNVIQGIADGVDTATRSKAVAAIVLRGVGDTFTAGYDLIAGGSWDMPYGAPEVEHREGAWDPVRDLAFMGNNVRRYEHLAVSETRAGRDQGLGRRWRDGPGALL